MLFFRSVPKIREKESHSLLDRISANTLKIIVLSSISI